MSREIHILTWACVLLSIAASPATSTKYRFSYGSCFKHSMRNEDTRIMLKINEDLPDSFAWLGDFAYADVMKFIKFTPIVYFTIDNEEGLRRSFRDSYHDQNYTVLRTNNKTRILGIWDDHDSGINDGGKDNPVKDVVRKIFLDSMDEPADSPRRTRKGGMYEAYYLDSHRKIKLILLDGRYSRDELKDKSIPEDQKSSLGAEQEAWLEQEIANSTAVITLIANGYQILPEDRPFSEKFYPKSRAHLLNLLHKYPQSKYLLLSGDVHFSELMTDPCSSDLLGYPLREVTSSGLTHSIEGLIGKIIGPSLDFFFPDTYSKTSDRYFRENYAIVDFDITDADRFAIDFQVKNIDGQPIINRRWTQTDFGVGKQTADAATRLQTYRECKKRQGGRVWRRVKNMVAKGLSPFHPFFYMIVVVLVVARWILLLVFSVVKRLCCKRKQIQGTDKIKTD